MIVDNIGWLFVDKLVRLGLGLIVIVWLARYLGTEQFGQFNYAVLYVSFFGALAALGLNNIVVRDIVRDYNGANATLGTAFVLQVVGALATVALIIGSITLLRPEDELTKVMVTILSFRLLFKASDVIRYWFEAQVESRYTVWIESGIFLLFAAIKIALIINGAPLLAFIWLALIEAAFIAIGFFGIYMIRANNLGLWSFRCERAKMLLKDSWSLIFMAMMLGIYTKIDIFMVEYFLGWDATGIYSAAIRVAESWYFVAVVFTTSVYPNLLASREKDEEVFFKKMAEFYSLMFWLPFVVSAMMAIFADDIMMILYGQKYEGVSSIFALYIWSSVFVFVITASSRWFLITDSVNSLLYRAIFGALTNVVLNYYLLSRVGLVGAAIATLISYFFVAYVYDFLDPKARRQVKIKVIAPLYPLVWGGYDIGKKKA